MAAGTIPFLGQLDLTKRATPSAPASGTARLLIGTDLVLRWVDDGGTVYEAADGQVVADHLNEVDPYAHTASHISDDSGLAQGDVAAALDFLDSDKVQSAAVTAITDVLDHRLDGLNELMLGGDYIQYTTGVLARMIYRDDFTWSSDTALSTGRIGETGWQYFESNAAGTIAHTTASAFHPGMIRLGTSATSGVYVALYKSPIGVGMFGAGAAFDLRLLLRTVNVDSNTQIRFGLTTDATSETPTDGIFAEKLTSDSTVWNNVKRIASSQTRAASAVSLPTANQFVQLRLRRIDVSNVGFSYSTQAGAFSTEEVVAFSGVTNQLSPFISVKNNTTTNKSLDIDFFGLLINDMAR